MSDVKAGYLAKVEISSGNQILGASSWAYTGESRDMHESTHFDTSGYKIDTPLMIAGGEITVSGDFRLNDTSGRDAIETAFKNSSELRDFRLYVDQSSYYSLDSTLFSGETTTGSYITITKAPTTVSFDTAGVGTMEFTAKVTGALTLVNAAENIIIQTVGRVEDGRTSDVTMLAKLLSLGSASDNSTIVVGFQWGTTDLLGTQSEYIQSISDLGYYGIARDISDISAADDVIYYRAIGVGVDDAAKIGYGAIISDMFHQTLNQLST